MNFFDEEKTPIIATRKSILLTFLEISHIFGLISVIQLLKSYELYLRMHRAFPFYSYPKILFFYL